MKCIKCLNHEKCSRYSVLTDENVACESFTQSCDGTVITEKEIVRVNGICSIQSKLEGKTINIITFGECGVIMHFTDGSSVSQLNGEITFYDCI